MPGHHNAQRMQRHVEAAREYARKLFRDLQGDDVDECTLEEFKHIQQQLILLDAQSRWLERRIRQEAMERYNLRLHTGRGPVV